MLVLEVPKPKKIIKIKFDIEIILKARVESSYPSFLFLFILKLKNKLSDMTKFF